MGAQIKFPGENNLNKGSYQDFGDIWLDFSKMGLQDQNVKIIGESWIFKLGLHQQSFLMKM